MSYRGDPSTRRPTSDVLGRRIEMDGSEVRARRRALGLTLDEMGERIGVSGDFVGRVERGKATITPRTAAAVKALKPRPLDRKPSLKDPMEREIEQALIDAGIDYITDQGGGTQSRLDFYLPELGVAIEAKRFYSSRIGEQIARDPNVIVAQGERAIRFLASAIRSGDFLLMMEPQEEVIRVDILKLEDGRLTVSFVTKRDGRRVHIIDSIHDDQGKAHRRAQQIKLANPGAKLTALV